MEYKSLYDGTKIPSLGLGTWGVGGKSDADHSGDKEAIAAIQEAIRLGYIHISTAEVYAQGHTEEIIGEAIKYLDRNKLIINTKVFKTHLKYDELISSAKTSLKRLQTDYIDIYMIHGLESNSQIKEAMRAMDYLVEQKLIKFIGVSNFSVKQIEQAQKYTKNKIVANEIEYNLVTRNKGHAPHLEGNYNMESEIIPYCQENNILIIAFRPLERGMILNPHPTMDKLAEKYNKTKAQIAINWLISKKNIITIPKSVSIEHLIENMGAIGWRLDEEDTKLLDSILYNNLNTP